jgi:hypothetical protein
VAAVKEVFSAIGGKSAVKLLLDRAQPLGSLVRYRNLGEALRRARDRLAHDLPANACGKHTGTPVHAGVRRREVHARSRHRHVRDPLESQRQSGAEPRTARSRRAQGGAGPDANGALRAGVAEDFPKWWRQSRLLFKVEGRDGVFSWLFQDSASAVDLRAPITIDGTNFGAPLDNLRLAMQAAGLESVDLWIATGGRDVAALVLPVLHPKAYLPVHWDGLFGAFKAGPRNPIPMRRSQPCSSSRESR